ncbi:low temperature requirement protein A [Solirubrobacter taibaiensis]|nr:low temperature requirement protein A [Solirubrobacter taibaiensis]
MKGKRVSYVELYLDLVFVLAVGRLAHFMVAEPEGHSVIVALGLFVVLWWTWIGFAVLYNRHGDDDRQEHLLFLVGSVPIGVAAVALEPAAHGDIAVFAGAMAVVRLVLAVSHGEGATDFRARITRAYVLSALLFAVSIVVPEPFTYFVWLVAVGNESRALLRNDKTQPGQTLDPHHFAERFALFMIILLGEVLIEAGQAPVEDTAGWIALAAAMVLAGALWWLYFDSAAELNLQVLELSGGSPTMARAIYAAGHMLPAFSLLAIAAGVGLMLEEDPPQFAFWLASTGVGVYLLGTRVFLRAARQRGLGAVLPILLIVATFNLGRLHEVLSPHEFLFFLTAWVTGCAALSTAAQPPARRTDSPPAPGRSPHPASPSPPE